MPYISISVLAKSIGVNGVHFDSLETVKVKQHRNGEEFTQTQIIANVRPYKRLQMRCPCCQNVCPGYDTKKAEPSFWRGPSIGTLPVFLAYTPRRIECPEHGVKTEYIPWADGTSRFLPSFNNEVTFLALSTSRSVVSEYLDINWRTVGNCIKACHTRLEPDISLRLKGVRRICVDETSYKKGHKYITVVYDMDTNQVIWIHAGHGLEIFKLFCETLDPEDRDKLELIAGDGAAWIDQCKEQYFPNAVRCMDPFHAVCWVNKAMDETRIQLAAMASREFNKARHEAVAEAQRLQTEWLHEYDRYKDALEELESLQHKRGRRSAEEKELMVFVREFEEKYGETMEIMASAKKGVLTEEQQKRLDELEAKYSCTRGCKYALGMNPENLSDYNMERLELIKVSAPELYEAYSLKEQFRVIIHMTDRQLAEKELDKWIEKAKNSGFDAFVKLANKIESKHKENILNTIQYGGNSSKSEQTNGMIKLLIKTACGFRNLDNMASLIYLRCSSLVIPLDNRYRPSPEKIEKIRERARARRKARAEAKKANLSA